MSRRRSPRSRGSWSRAGGCSSWSTSAPPRIAAKQDKIPFRYPLIGCHPNRDMLRAIKASPLAVESVRAGELPKAPEIKGA